MEEKDTSGYTDSTRDVNEEYGKLCHPCLSEGESVIAEAFCVTCNEFICKACLKAHRKFTITKNHEIKSKDEMPLEYVHGEPCSDLCDVHKQEIVKFYCQEHNEVGCGDCMVLQHRSCQVKLIPGVSGNYSNSFEFRHIDVRLNYFMQEITWYQQKLASNTDFINHVNLKAVARIKQFRIDINAYLDRAEEKLLNEVKQVQNQDSFLMNKLKHECDVLHGKVKDALDERERNVHANTLFVSSKTTIKLLNMCKEKLEEINTRCKWREYKYEPSSHLLDELGNANCLGSISLRFPKRSPMYCMTESRVIFKKKLCIREQNDSDCFITGMALLSANEILLADCDKYCLKIFDIQKNRVTSRFLIRPSASPWDVTIVDNQTIAATIPKEGKLLFMKTENGLSESHCLKVNKWCRGIDHKNGLLAVSFTTTPDVIQIMDMKGNVLHEFNSRYSDLTGFQNYLAMSFDSTSVYVSGYWKNTVYKFTIEGKYLASFEFTKGSCLRHLAVTRDGTVVVCCEGKNNEIIAIDAKTGKGRYFYMKDLHNPMYVLVSEEHGRVFLTESKSLKDQNYLKILNLK